MSINIAIIICIILAVLFYGIVFAICLTHFGKGVLSTMIIFILIAAGVILSIFAISNLSDSIKTDYRLCETIDTYKIHDISYENNETVIHYIDSNKQLKHVKSTDVKIFYDLQGDQEPYAVRNEYWRWFIYWDELEVHIKE